MFIHERTLMISRRLQEMTILEKRIGPRGVRLAFESYDQFALTICSLSDLNFMVAISDSLAFAGFSARVSMMDEFPSHFYPESYIEELQMMCGVNAYLVLTRMEGFSLFCSYLGLRADELWGNLAGYRRLLGLAEKANKYTVSREYFVDFVSKTKSTMPDESTAEEVANAGMKFLANFNRDLN